MSFFRAPAKINLSLQVTGRRADGYHLLDSLVTFTEIGDILEVVPASEISLGIEGPFAEWLSAADNLVMKAANLLKRTAERAGNEVPGATITLDKILPIASGIGGGSADAAAALTGLGDLWGLLQIELTDLALQLGADVPMCLVSSPLVARGVGDQINKVTLPSLNLVLVNPGIEVSTTEIFANLQISGHRQIPELPDDPMLDQLVDWLGNSGNDLQAPAIARAPIIQQVLNPPSRTEQGR